MSTHRTPINSMWPGFALVGLMLLVHGLAFYTSLPVNLLGIFPRTPSGLIGIAAAPLLHQDLIHLLSNAFPLFALMAFLYYTYPKVATEALVWLYLAGGFYTWMLGREAYHIGASGLVYGVAGFLFFSGFFRRDPQSIVVAGIVTVLYGGLLYGLFPIREGVSWESHLSGAVIGAQVAWNFRHVDRPARKQYSWELEEEPEPVNWISSPVFSATITVNPWLLFQGHYRYRNPEELAALTEKHALIPQEHGYTIKLPGNTYYLPENSNFS
jgi:membrane associated rhomboid family serine protease